MAKSVAIMVYGGEDPTRNPLTEDYYSALAEALITNGFTVKPVLYDDAKQMQLSCDLVKFDAVLVWVNPDEQGGNRHNLDRLLQQVADKGVYVSTHPEVIMKIGTKKVLYTTRDMDWGSDVKLYTDYEDFKSRFSVSPGCNGIRVLKQYRGSSGRGIYKISLDNSGKHIRTVPASAPYDQRILSMDDFCKEFNKVFENGGLLIDQEWSQGIGNGMVRCYITGTTVSGFGYQESIALSPHTANENMIKPMSKRYYFSEDCGLFQDLRSIMEEKWIPQLQEIHAITDEMMPILWDIDLFINDPNNVNTAEKYTLCEINVSCVSPFPPSCVSYIVEGLRKRL